MKNELIELVGVLKLGPMPAPIEEHQARIRNEGDKLEAVFVVDDPIIPTMDEQARDGNACQSGFRGDWECLADSPDEVLQMVWA